jgi:uncharacterized protein
MTERELTLSRYLVRTDEGEHTFLYSGMSGALLRLTSEEARQLDQPVAELPEPLLVKLLANGLVISDRDVELNALRNRFERERDNGSWLSLTLVTSLGCNFDCPYCFEDKTNSIMSAGVADGILDFVRSQIGSIEGVSVTWYGGEPLMGKRVIDELSQQLIELCDSNSLGYQASIVTNGYLLDRPAAEMLARRKVADAQITLDGPPIIHDRMRPLLSGGNTFEKILSNITAVCDILPISIRVNLDTENAAHLHQLLQLLADAGLAGRVTVYPAQIIPSDNNADAPSNSYSTTCFTKPEFAEFELEFEALARSLGFSSPYLPGPKSTPCSAISNRNLVVGSRGELYKCWESVGDAREVFGNILRMDAIRDSRVAKWLQYSPLDDEECRACIALPVCMGGCAAHAFSELQHDDRCGTFRHNHEAKVREFVRAQVETPTRALIPIQPV